ncbi:S1C family serine protease [Lysinibacillus odysseyi]|uniref:2-alkenal reductase n=1 Tax=Lysinibacillus odysseyi 34hs-1 = NBRC 100172 TaxID=1220589 RepID=A0A0A3IPY8_9BACI|nr:trypsin-like peptidase domain-containing protein [Lysinibacillus odysseyi]KGR86794.1 2-alkenal reductase [Lysinibacillus odysseyi 34hs-1 = NBRC 100172]
MDEQRNNQNNPELTPLQERLRREEEERNRRASQKKGGSKAGYFITGLSGVIVGVLLMWLLLPSLADQLPGSKTEKTEQSGSTAGVEQTATVVTTDVTSAVEKVSEAVVGISNYQVAQNSLGGFWFGQGGMQQNQNQNEEGKLQEAGTGSGVVYKIENGEAYIVTNNHVIEKAEKLEITLKDGSKKEATLVGSDIWTDLAVIKVKADGIKTVANFGDSEVLKQGETVIAIGNPLGLDFYGSVTVGVISGTDRAVPVDLNGDGTEDWQSEVLQTDAAINGGNSGGALVNLNGDLIGINSMKIASEQVEGLGFAIPINTVIPIIKQLEKNGEVVRPAMGISLLDLTDIPAFYQAQTLELPEGITTGVVVAEVTAGSAAAEAGMKQYDVIYEMDGEKIENVIDLRKHLYTKTDVGDKLKVKVYRAGKTVELNLVLKESTD